MMRPKQFAVTLQLVAVVVAAAAVVVAVSNNVQPRGAKDSVDSGSSGATRRSVGWRCCSTEGTAVAERAVDSLAAAE